MQLETAERLGRALATYAVVAWRLLWLTYEAPQTPEGSCEAVLPREDWQVLHRVVHPDGSGSDIPSGLINPATKLIKNHDALVISGRTLIVVGSGALKKGN